MMVRIGNNNIKIIFKELRRWLNGKASTNSYDIKTLTKRQMSMKEPVE